jgi:allophanate hydrolase subunit 2
MRLDAAEFPRSTRSQPQMSSIGLVEGAIQITPAGEPIVMLANHPTTGGYPVLAVVDPDDLPLLVQSRPGTSVRFRRA